MSVPDAKALSPAPWNTSTLIERSLFACSHTSASRSYIAKVKALRACGRLNVERPTPSCTLKRRSLAAVDCSCMRFWSCDRSLVERFLPTDAGDSSTIGDGDVFITG